MMTLQRIVVDIGSGKTETKPLTQMEIKKLEARQKRIAVQEEKAEQATELLRAKKQKVAKGLSDLLDDVSESDFIEALSFD